MNCSADATAENVQHLRPRAVRCRALCGLLLSLLLLMCALLLSASAVADSYDERRVRTGARLLRSLLAADLALEQKARTHDGHVLVWVYNQEPRLQSELSELIAPSSGKAALLRGLPVRVVFIDRLPAPVDASTARASVADAPAPVSLFLASAPDPAALPALIDWSTQQGVILFSPFEGHVERGVASGLAIGAKVQPFLNSTALKEAGITLKPFFLRVAKVLP